jgi:hypothetical protein
VDRNIPMKDRETQVILIRKFEAKHATAAIRYFVAASEKFIAEDWDGVALKTGKFVEAVTKALMIAGGKSVPQPRDFKAGNELRQLEQLDRALYSEIVRIVIPRACVFMYEVVNNRGGRHDAGVIDANAMDATALIPQMSWVLAEMVRYCSIGGDTDAAMSLIEKLTNKVYPFFEDIDGRKYVNIDGVGAADVALLLLYAVYPKRISRQDLIDSIKRHGPKASAASMAVHRLKKLVDDDDGQLKLRGLGRQKAEDLMKRLRQKS